MNARGALAAALVITVGVCWGLLAPATKALFAADPSYSAEVGGHTDNVGKAAYNMSLSDRRAAAVKDWLVAHGVAASRLSSRGYGDTVPLVPNDSDAHRARNRRVELKRKDCK